MIDDEQLNKLAIGFALLMMILIVIYQAISSSTVDKRRA
ncbi:hypothetical protein HG535_0G01090 [Zygotorulaspora mrakii]|uniref:Uncharacterized protein n=1 Tax=Zygotorulaspora mrakii TaxID=42260 RepID=A0A7H9B672_ZYGMR|nr:uncharacterized protein HG535_0G01090 [Zygotorulaspora mrakii]QLG74225.1 hypothetical protein HG535_0G01090 [Zygotorulaspora mrakii]